MNRKTTYNALGGYQPFLFCIGMYFVALFFSILVCSAIFNAMHPKTSLVKNSAPMEQSIKVQEPILLTAVK